MAPKLSNIPDTYLWFGLGVFTFIAIKSVSHGLSNLRSLTQLRHTTPLIPPPSDQNLQQPHPAPEDSIATTSLVTLSSSPNRDIRESATKIFCHRFNASSSAIRLLLRDLHSPDPELRHKAELGARLLRMYAPHTISERLSRRLTRLEEERDRGRNLHWGERRGGEEEEEEDEERRGGWRVYQPADLEVGQQGGGLEERDMRQRRRETVVIHDGEGEGEAGDVGQLLQDLQGMLGDSQGARVAD